jgi:hypothetical protein
MQRLLIIPTLLTVCIFFLVLGFSKSIDAKVVRYVWEWPWGMSCAEIEREYGKGLSSDFAGSNVIMYKIQLLGHVWEARFTCKNRGLIWGDGEFSFLKIAQGNRKIPRTEVYKQCDVVLSFLRKKYGEHTHFSDSRKPGYVAGSVHIWFEDEKTNTRVKLYCQDWGREFIDFSFSRFNR